MKVWIGIPCLCFTKAGQARIEHGVEDTATQGLTLTLGVSGLQDQVEVFASETDQRVSTGRCVSKVALSCVTEDCSLAVVSNPAAALAVHSNQQ